jgi:hypothetical protein
MKWLFKWCFRLILLLVAVIIAMVLSKDAILKAVAEQRIRARTGMDVKIGRFSFGLLSPVVTLENLKLITGPNSAAHLSWIFPSYTSSTTAARCSNASSISPSCVSTWPS